MPILFPCEEGCLLEAELEAYVVPGMTVPLLVGEDFLLNYEVGVERDVHQGVTLKFGDPDWRVKASSTLYKGAIRQACDQFSTVHDADPLSLKALASSNGLNTKV